MVRRKMESEASGPYITELETPYRRGKGPLVVAPENKEKMDGGLQWRS